MEPFCEKGGERRGTTHHDMWSVSVVKRLNVLLAIFEKYPKMLHVHTFLPQYTHKFTKTLVIQLL